MKTLEAIEKAISGGYGFQILIKNKYEKHCYSTVAGIYSASNWNVYTIRSKRNY